MGTLSLAVTITIAPIVIIIITISISLLRQAKANSRQQKQKQQANAKAANAKATAAKQKQATAASAKHSAYSRHPGFPPPWRHGKRPRPNSLLNTCASPARIIDLGKVRGAFCLRTCTCLARFGRHSADALLLLLLKDHSILMQEVYTLSLWGQSCEKRVFRRPTHASRRQ